MKVQCILCNYVLYPATPRQALTSTSGVSSRPSTYSPRGERSELRAHESMTRETWEGDGGLLASRCRCTAVKPDKTAPSSWHSGRWQHTDLLCTCIVREVPAGDLGRGCPQVTSPMARLLPSSDSASDSIQSTYLPDADDLLGRYLTYLGSRFSRYRILFPIIT